MIPEENESALWRPFYLKKRIKANAMKYVETLLLKSKAWVFPATILNTTGKIAGAPYFISTEAFHAFILAQIMEVYINHRGDTGKRETSSGLFQEIRQNIVR